MTGISTDVVLEARHALDAAVEPSLPKSDWAYIHPILRELSEALEADDEHRFRQALALLKEAAEVAAWRRAGPGGITRSARIGESTSPQEAEAPDWFELRSSDVWVFRNTLIHAFDSRIDASQADQATADS
jgi:hypothetical protein